MKTFRATFLLSSVVLSAAVPLAASNVVTDWTAIASTAIVKNGGKSPGSSAVWFAYPSLAVYDAVKRSRANTGRSTTTVRRRRAPLWMRRL
jgi:hypothetical protein